MITKEEWDKMKEDEKYGMIARMMRDIAKLEIRIEELEKAVKGDL